MAAADCPRATSTPAERTGLYVMKLPSRSVTVMEPSGLSLTVYAWLPDEEVCEPAGSVGAMSGPGGSRIATTGPDDNPCVGQRAGQLPSGVEHVDRIASKPHSRGKRAECSSRRGRDCRTPGHDERYPHRLSPCESSLRTSPERRVTPKPGVAPSPSGAILSRTQCVRAHPCSRVRQRPAQYD